MSKFAFKVFAPLANGAMIIGSIASIVVRDFAENPKEAYRHQKKEGFLTADFWKS
ncbi:hypothetical protein KC953_00830 [Candidatus Saccharibacteria bacterium]|nr:hypothetical protein [Candidatus Saccharibacteria bacterium]